MDKSDFKPDTRYTITWRTPDGGVRPANLYVFRAYDGFLIARLTGADGLLRKITYPEVLKVIAAVEVRRNDRYFVPAALLDEKFWRGRELLEHYASSPDRGK